MKVVATPICLDNCSSCGFCTNLCSTNAITICNDEVITDINKCIMCMACVVKCPNKARVLPTALQEGMNQKLAALKDVVRDNEFYR